MSDAAEKALLGTILLDSHALNQARGVGIHKEDFGLDSHRRIFARMAELIDAGCVPDLVTLTDELRRRKEVEAVGGIAYLASLTEGLPRLSSIDQWANSILHDSQNLQIMQLCECVQAAARDGEDPEALTTRLETRLSEIRESATKSTFQRITEAIVPTLDNLERVRTRKGELKGLPSGNPVWDKVCRGFLPGVHIWAAETAAGKTSAMVQATVAIASAGIAVLLFSLEMTVEEIILRMLSIVSGVSFPRIQDPKWATAQEMASLRYAAQKLVDWPIFIDSDSSPHVDQIIARSKIAIRHHGVKFIGIDYAQIVRADGKDERLRVSAVSRGITRLSKDERIPVMLLSQLSRSDRTASGRRPRLSDLSESSQLEKDAHTVTFLHRPKDAEDQMGSAAQIIVAKHRNGATGYWPMIFNQATLSFEEQSAAESIQRELAV